MNTLRLCLKLRLARIVMLLSACAFADERVISVLPSVAQMVPLAGVACKRESKSLLNHDSEAVDWRHTQWDVDIVAAADMFIAVGLPQERFLLDDVHRINPHLKVVDAGVGLRRIKDNPYFFVSTENQEKMMKNLYTAYNYASQVILGDSSLVRSSIYAGFNFKRKSYTVAISHPAFAYECQDYGVKTIMLDIDRIGKDAQYRKQQIDSLISQRVNIVLKLPGRGALPRDFLVESRLREVEFDVLRADLIGLLDVFSENFQRRDYELEHKEELSKMYAPILLNGVRFDSFEIPNGVCLSQLVGRVQIALDASSDIDLPLGKRKLNLDFLDALGASSKRVAHATLKNVTGLDVIRYACRTIDCDCTFITPWIEDEILLRTLYIVNRQGTEGQTPMVE